MNVYFDNAATTPVSEEVIETMVKVLRNDYGNPSSIHADGRKARAIIENARKTVAKYINASIGEIFFTSCGTESNNMILKCAVRDLGVTRIISSPTEHHCVLHSLETLESYGQAEIEWVRQDSKGCVDLDHLEALLKNSDKKTLVSLMHANNEIGTMLNLERVSELCAENGAWFHSDTVQTMGYYPIDVSKLKISFLTGSAHKFHGPKGVGFVYINSGNIIKPYIDGGAQERNMRGGTENIAGIAGLAKALELAYENLSERQEKIETLRAHFSSKLEEEIPDIRFNGTKDGCYKVLSVSFPPSPKSDLLLMNLDIMGISASGGSACSSGADAGSHVLKALKADPERTTIRFSFSHLNTTEEVEYTVDQLKKILVPEPVA